MRDTDLQISNNGGVFLVKVSGRANFEYAVPLRNIAKGNGEVKGIVIDLGDCSAMDSTFMGVLSMLALKGKRENTAVELFNASSVLQKLLRELGVLKLFVLKEGESGAGATTQTDSDASMLTKAETVSEAHQALVEADAGNQQKFGAVIDYARADVERLKKAENK